MNRWPTRKLGDFVAKKSGSVDPSRFLTEVFDLYSIPAFDSGVPEVRAGHEIGSAKQVVESGDVLLSRIVPHIRRAWVVGADRGRRLIASSEWIVFRTPHLNARFLQYFLVGDPFHARFLQTVSGVGGSLLRAKATEVAKIEIPIPPLAEQKRIVKLLDEADELKKLRAKADGRAAALIPAVFDEMFGNPTHKKKMRLPIKLLGELASTVTKGTTPQTLGRQYTREGVPFLRAENLQGGRVVVDGNTLRIDAETHSVLARSVIQRNDVLLSIAGTIGRAAIVGQDMPEMNCNQAVGIIRLAPDSILPSFLLSWLKTRDAQSQIMGAQVTQTVSNLSLAQIRKLELPVPALTLQKEFAARVSEIDAVRAEQTTTSRRVDDLFRSALHRAFQGEL